MAELQFTISDYIAYVLISNNKRLLVEGRDDYRVFTRLLDSFDISRSLVDVDEAGCLTGFDEPIGNRDKVELVCSMIRNKNFSKKLVGFVDREFRGFSSSPELEDTVKSHYIDARLVWTRGHSIENYLFDFDTLSEPISSLTTTPRYRLALNLFERNLERTIEFACIFSLLGLETNGLGLIESCISWRTLSFSEDEIDFDLAALQGVMETKNLSVSTITEVLNRYGYWKDVVLRADFDTVRWMCHGHLGLKFVWAAFKRSVFEISQRAGSRHAEKEAERAVEPREEIRLNVCAQKWIHRSRGGEVEYPIEVLRMLELVS